ncbi:MAG: putative DNA modification/repair radical SAM protein, partial [Elusimicrobiales bacterium]|nr:putative DNA modification/repair radical SAM protein [Elusimicrobiales bacterium]
MDISEKLEILASSAKYDASCASSYSYINRTKKTVISGICHSWSRDGRCISLLKILYTNICEFDCGYCINRKSNNIKRAIFNPDEICILTSEFYKRNYIKGLFLSSAIFKNPDFTMELMINTIKKLRKDYNFNGYIHTKIIPGCCDKLILEAIKNSNRVSVNIELSDSKKLFDLTSKQKDMIIKPMKYARDKINEIYEKKPYGGQSTQIIVGAINDTDKEILELSNSLYTKMNLKRVYYSAFINVNNDKRLNQITNPPLLREHRLYQADWLLRIYGFRVDEIFPKNIYNLKEEIDPKLEWAIRNIDLFPIEITKASFEELIRVPGIGIRKAKKIINERKHTIFDEKALEKLKIPKKAINFITIKGKFYG